MIVQVGISDWGRFGENGVEIKNPNFPYRLLADHVEDGHICIGCKFHAILLKFYLFAEESAH